MAQARQVTQLAWQRQLAKKATEDEGEVLSEVALPAAWDACRRAPPS